MTSPVGRTYIITTFVADSLGIFFYPASGSKQATVTSSNPDVLRPASDVVVIGNSSGGGSVRVDVVGPGTATLTLSDPSGVFAPKTSAPIVVAPTSLLVSSGNPPSKSARSVGMHQLVDASVQIATLGSIADSIRLRSTDPTIAQPTASAIVSVYNGTSFSIRGGDRSGTAWIVASGPGLVSDSLPVTVGRPAIAVVTPASVGGSAGQTNILYIQLLDQTGNARVTGEKVTFRIQSSDPNVVTADSTITVLAGQSQSAWATVHLVGAGLAVLRVVDDRNVPYAYEPGASTIIQVLARQTP